VTESHYPSDGELDAIADFEGTPHALVDALIELWWTPKLVAVTEGKKNVTVHLVTGGWSGNESLVDAADRGTLFHTLFWRRSSSGGLHVYKIPLWAWDHSMRLGRIVPVAPGCCESCGQALPTG